MKIKITVLLLIIVPFWIQSQHLTISTSGETGPTSGTNWSITGNTLNVASSGTANIHPSVITNHLTNIGSLTINLPWQSGTTRDIYINNTIAYTGSNARTLTINAANDLIVASGVSITSSNASMNLVLRSVMVSGTPDHGRIQLNGATITTNGGHFWAGGGVTNTTWNGLTVGNTYSRTWADDIAGITFIGSSLTTGGGSVYMAGMSHNTSDGDGENYGINIRNSTISSGVGQIDILGELKGMYGTGSGLGIFGNEGPVSISATTGAINLTGTGVDQAGTNTGWRRGLLLYTLSSSGISVTTNSGNITISGSAAFPINANDDMMGIQLGSTQAIADGVKITSRTGNILLMGSNSRENAGQYSNAVQFIAANVANSIRIGHDGTNAYSGNITIEGNSIIQNNVNTGSGSISVQSTGTLTIRPSGSAFTYLRAGASGTLTFDNDWNFGTTLSGFTFGKSTNNLAISFSNDITLNGPFTAYGSNMGLNGIAANGDVYIRSTTYIDQNGAKTTSTNGGDLVYWAGGSGESYIRPGTITTNGGHVFMGGDFDAVGTRTWQGLTVGGGYAFSTLYAGVALRGNIDTRVTSNQSVGGDVLLAGESYQSAQGDVEAESTNRSISTGNGNITFMPYSEVLQSGSNSFQMVLSTTGRLSVAPASGKTFWSGQTRTYNGSMSSTTFNGSSALAGLQILNFSSISGLEIGTYSGTDVVGDAAYTSSNVKNMQLDAAFTISGPISVFGNSLNIQQALQTTASGSAIRLTSNGTGASGLTNGWISIASGRNLTTNGGDIVLWSNRQNITSGQANNEIVFSGSNTLSSSGGRIIIAGGLDNGANGGTASDGIPDGYAYRGSYSGEAIDIRANATLNSGGGGIIIRGEQNGSDDGIGSDATFTISNAGAVTIEGKNATNTYRSVRLGTSNITSTAANAPVSISGTTHLWNDGLVSITTSGGAVLLAGNTDDATDGESTVNGYVQFRSGLSITTNGGNITLGGGNSTGSSYALGSSSASFTEGIRIDGSVSLSSGGGNIALRGKSSATSVGAGVGASGIMFHALTSAGSINSSIGTILLDGFSQTSGAGANANAGILFWNISTNTFTIQSSNTSANAITLNGYATGTSGQAYGIETETSNTLNILATSSGGGITLNTGNSIANNSDAVFRGPTNILAVGGPISIKGGQLGGVANGFFYTSNTFNIGSKAAAAITASSSNLLIEFDRVEFTSTKPQIATTGSVTWQSKSANFGATQVTNDFQWNQNSQTMTGLTIGKSNNTADITCNSAQTVAGPIAIYGGNISINENLTSSNGSPISLFGNALTFGANKTVTSNNGQLIIAPQNAANTIGLGGATGTLSLPASYFSTHFSDGFSNIQIGSNSQSGNMTANAFTLRDNMTFLTTGSLTLGGRPVLGSNNLTLGSAISSISAGPSGYFQTNGTGKVMSTLANNASTLYPVGNAYYNGVTITNKTNATDMFSVIIKDSVLGNGDTGRQITTPHVRATWDISKTNANAGSGVDFVFSWDTAQERGGINNFILNHHNGTVWKIAAGTRGTVSGTSTKTITHTGYTGSFSPFAFGNSGTPLPVELIAFNAQCMNEFIQIDWTTASEKNNKMFELYKSDNAIDWSLIHTADGQGDKATETNYQFMDYKKQPAYYRLKDIDFDGIENWSPIIFADCKNDVSDIQVYPNPASDFIKVIIPYEESTTLNILSMEGKILKTLPLVSKNSLININDLSGGIYIIEIITSKEKLQNKIIKR